MLARSKEIGGMDWKYWRQVKKIQMLELIVSNLTLSWLEILPKKGPTSRFQNNKYYNCTKNMT